MEGFPCTNYRKKHQKSNETILKFGDYLKEKTEAISAKKVSAAFAGNASEVQNDV